MTNIAISELRVAFDRLLSHLEEHGVDVVDVVDDFYWDVPQEARYDQLDQPKQLNVGQLTDDIYEIKRLAHGNTPAIGFGLVWLSSVLRRIGETSPI